MLCTVQSGENMQGHVRLTQHTWLGCLSGLLSTELDATSASLICSVNLSIVAKRTEMPAHSLTKMLSRAQGEHVGSRGLVGLGTSNGSI